MTGNTAGVVKTMTAEETAAENSRLEQELRKAHEQIGRLEGDVAAANDRCELGNNMRVVPKAKPVVQTVTDDTAVFELDLPGLFHIVLRGPAATVFAESLWNKGGKNENSKS